MKVIPIALQAHYDSGNTTVAYGLRINRTDGRIFAFTSSDVDAEVGGVVYSAAQGLDPTAVVSTAGLAVDNIELTTLDDGTLFVREEVLAGVWQNSTFLIIRYNWGSPSDGAEALMAGTIGTVKMLRGSIVCELRGLQQFLQQPVGSVTSKTCRARFADYPTPNGNNRCRLHSSDWSDARKVTTSTGRRSFDSTPDGSPGRAADWYNDGVITWTSGQNAGIQSKVKSFGADEVFTLWSDTPYPIQVNDHFTCLAGCRKRLLEDCRDRFDNVLNFSGEPHLPGIDAVTA